MEDQLEVRSIRNNKTKIHLGTTGISQPETYALPSPSTFQTMTGFTLLCGHTRHSVFLQETGGMLRSLNKTSLLRYEESELLEQLSRWSSQPLSFC